MTAPKQTDQWDVDPEAALRYLTEWAARFHDDSSPARVTDVLMAFAFVAGLNLGAAAPAATAALLRRMEEEMPSASEHARLLARGLLDSIVRKAQQDNGASATTFEPSPGP